MNTDAATAGRGMLRSSTNYSTNEASGNETAKGSMRNGLSVTEKEETIRYVADLKGSVKIKTMSEIKVKELGFDRSVFNTLNTLNEFKDNKRFCRSHSAPTGNIMSLPPDRISMMESQSAVDGKNSCKSLP